MKCLHCPYCDGKIELMTKQEVVALSNLSERTIREKRNQGRLPSISLGKNLTRFFLRKDVISWLAEYENDKKA